MTGLTVEFRHVYNHGDKAYFQVAVNGGPTFCIRSEHRRVIEAIRERGQEIMRDHNRRGFFLRVMVAGVAHAEVDYVLNLVTLALDVRGVGVGGA